MEELVGEAPRERLQDVGGILAGLQVAERPLELHAARFLGRMAGAVGLHGAMKPQRAARGLMQVKRRRRRLPSMAP